MEEEESCDKGGEEDDKESHGCESPCLAVELPGIELRDYTHTHIHTHTYTHTHTHPPAGGRSRVNVGGSVFATAISVTSTKY